MNARMDEELAGPSWTVATYADQWIGSAWTDRLQPSSIAHYRHMLRAYVVPIIGDVRLAELVPWHVCHLLTRLRDAGYSAGTGRIVLAVLRLMLWQAKEDQLVSRNVAAQVEAPRRSWPHHLSVNGYESRQRAKAAR